MEEFKRQKKRHTLAMEITFAICGLIILFIACSELKPLVQKNNVVLENTKLEEKEVFQCKTDLLARYELVNLLGENETGYFVELPNGELITISADQAGEETQALIENCWMVKELYEDQKVSKEQYESTTFMFSAKLYSHEDIIPAEVFKETEAFRSLTTEQTQQFHNWHMDVKRDVDYLLGVKIFGAIIVLCLGLILYTWIPKQFIWRDPAFCEYLRKQPNQEYAKSKICDFLNKAQMEKDFWMDESFMVAFNNNGKAVLCETKEIIGIHTVETEVNHNVTQMLTKRIARNYMPQFMNVATVQGKCYQFVLNGGPRSGQRVLDYVEENFPWIVTERRTK